MADNTITLQTIVLLWRKSLEFVVDVIDPSPTPYTPQGALILYVRPNVKHRAHCKRSLEIPDKSLYWAYAASSERRILEEVWKEWLQDRLDLIMEDYDQVETTKSQGKDVAYLELRDMLKQRDERNNSWRTLGSNKQKGTLWAKSEQDRHDDRRKQLDAIHGLMLRDVAQRWLEIITTDNDVAAAKEETSQTTTTALEQPLQYFTIRLNSPPPLPPPPTSSTTTTTTSPSRKNRKRKEDHTTNGSSTTQHQYTTPRFAEPGTNGLTARVHHFHQTQQELQAKLHSVVPLRQRARAARNKAKEFIDIACLTEEEMEATRRIQDELLAQQRLEAGRSVEQRLTVFLCSCNMSKHEKTFLRRDITYNDLPALSQKDLLDTLGIKNMMTRRKFLKAIVMEFGQGGGQEKKEGGGKKEERRSYGGGGGGGGGGGEDSSSGSSSSEEEVEEAGCLR